MCGNEFGDCLSIAFAVCVCVCVYFPMRLILIGVLGERIVAPANHSVRQCDAFACATRCDTFVLHYMRLCAVQCYANSALFTQNPYKKRITITCTKRARFSTTAAMFFPSPRRARLHARLCAVANENTVPPSSQPRCRSREPVQRGYPVTYAPNNVIMKS